MWTYVHSRNYCLSTTTIFLAGNQFFKVIGLNLSRQPKGAILIKFQNRCIWEPVQLNWVAKGVMEKRTKNFKTNTVIEMLKWK